MARSSSSSSSSSSNSASSASTAPKKRSKAPKYQEPVDANGALIVGDTQNLHIGDYVGFERIGTNREWNLALGRVVSFPSSQTVKVVHYDPCNPNTVAQDPIGEAELKKKAQKRDQMKVWKAREGLKKDLRKAVEEENEAARRLFEAREETLRKQQAANSHMSNSYHRLDLARKKLKEHMHLWCCLRSMIIPPPDMVPVVKALMLVLHEDKAISSWESMRTVMMRNDFFKRLIDTDCAVQPMSAERCERIEKLLSEKERRLAREEARREKEEAKHAKNLPKKTQEEEAAEKKTTTTRKCNHDHSGDIGIMYKLDQAVREWIKVQIELSAAGEARNAIIDECFTEQQEQRVLLREVNDMRANISRIEEEMLNKKKTILGYKDQQDVLKLEMKDYEVDTVFHRRTYASENDGRFVHVVLLRSGVIVNFGALEGCEDDKGYVRLGRQQQDLLRQRVFQSYIVHDADTMEDLLNITDQNEKELAELQNRIDHLRHKSHLSPEEAEELNQLTTVYEERDRQYRSTLARIAHMYACCRGARDITLSEKKSESQTKYLRPTLKWYGNWEGVLEDKESEEELRAAVLRDLQEVFGPDAEISDIRFREGHTDTKSGQWRPLHKKRAAARRFDEDGNELPPVEEKHLIVNYNVKYTGPMQEKEIVHHYQHAEYPDVEEQYERKNPGKRTYPINTMQQETDCAEEEGDVMMREVLPENTNVSGAGVQPKKKMYHTADGTETMRFDEETERESDWRRSTVVVAVPRNDYEATVIPTKDNYAQSDASGNVLVSEGADRANERSAARGAGGAGGARSAGGAGGRRPFDADAYDKAYDRGYDKGYNDGRNGRGNRGAPAYSGTNPDYKTGLQDGYADGIEDGEADAANAGNRNRNRNADAPEDYNKGYDRGYNKGYNTGRNPNGVRSQPAHPAGASDDYNRGMDDGYNNGFDDGRADADRAAAAAPAGDRNRNRPGDADRAYNDGFDDGYDKGYNDGRNPTARRRTPPHPEDTCEDYNRGLDDGYNYGYDDGVNDAANQRPRARENNRPNGDDNYNKGYGEGYDKGYNDGHDRNGVRQPPARDEYADKPYNDGLEDGYNNGYDDGANDGANERARARDRNRRPYANDNYNKGYDDGYNQGNGDGLNGNDRNANPNNGNTNPDYNDGFNDGYNNGYDDGADGNDNRVCPRDNHRPNGDDDYNRGYNDGYNDGRNGGRNKNKNRDGGAGGNNNGSGSGGDGGYNNGGGYGGDDGYDDGDDEWDGPYSNDNLLARAGHAIADWGNERDGGDDGEDRGHTGGSGSRDGDNNGGGDAGYNNNGGGDGNNNGGNNNNGGGDDDGSNYRDPNGSPSYNRGYDDGYNDGRGARKNNSRPATNPNGKAAKKKSRPQRQEPVEEEYPEEEYQQPEKQREYQEPQEQRREPQQQRREPQQQRREPQQQRREPEQQRREPEQQRQQPRNRDAGNRSDPNNNNNNNAPAKRSTAPAKKSSSPAKRSTAPANNNNNNNNAPAKRSTAPAKKSPSPAKRSTAPANNNNNNNAPAKRSTAPAKKSSPPAKRKNNTRPANRRNNDDYVDHGNKDNDSGNFFSNLFKSDSPKADGRNNRNADGSRGGNGNSGPGYTMEDNLLARMGHAIAGAGNEDAGVS